MQTEFTCGIYTAKFTKTSVWELYINSKVGMIHADGLTIVFNNHLNFAIDDFMQIAVIMNNIKLQYQNGKRRENDNTINP